MTQNRREKKNSIVIGLTGGIASGKSTVSRILTEHGAILLDGDKIAREIVKEQDVLDELREAFGEDIIDDEGGLKRKTLGSMVFSCQDRLEELNRITHPRIAQRIEKDLQALKHVGEKDGTFRIILLDGALLLEMGLDHLTDEVWVIAVDRETQIKRLMDRDGLNRDQALQRIDAQMEEGEKRKAADVIIYNTGSLEELTEQVKVQWQRLMEEMKGE